MSGNSASPQDSGDKESMQCKRCEPGQATRYRPVLQTKPAEAICEFATVICRNHVRYHWTRLKLNDFNRASEHEYPLTPPARRRNLDKMNSECPRVRKKDDVPVGSIYAPRKQHDEFPSEGCSQVLCSSIVRMFYGAGTHNSYVELIRIAAPGVRPLR